MKKAAKDLVTPFDWRRYTANASEAGDRDRKAPARREKAMTVKERVERIMAHRWGNPYCKPGAAY
jgi:hypothetical protein